MDTMPSPRLLPLGVVLVPAVLLAFACGGSTSSGSGDDADAGPDAALDAKLDQSVSDGGADGATDGGGGLYPAGTTQIVATSKGGHTAPGPDGSVCTLVDTTYTLVVASRALSWNVCEATDAGPLAFRTGQRTISASELDGVEDAIRGLRRTTDTKCGADAPSETLVLTTPTGNVSYYDDFYFCDPKDTKIYVSGMSAVLSALGALSQ